MGLNIFGGTICAAEFPAETLTMFGAIILLNIFTIPERSFEKSIGS